MERIDKIQFLNDVLQGRITSDDLRPKIFLQKIQPGGDGEYFLNGRQISRTQFETHLKREPAYLKGKLNIQVQVC